MIEVVRTEQIHFKSDVVSNMCHLSKNLYNYSNYVVRQEYIHNQRWIRYNELYTLVKCQGCYKQLPAKTSQQILMVFDRNWKSFFESIKDWEKHPDKYNGRPSLPKYKPKDGVNLLVFTNQQVKIKDGYLKFPKRVQLTLKTRLPDDINLREVRIIPNQFDLVCEIVYKIEVKCDDLDESNVIGIDLGVSNIVTIANNFGEQPTVVKGGVVKSINQFYNKKKGRLQSIYDLQKIKSGKKLEKLYYSRNLKINDYFHKLSRFIVNYCKEHNVGTIVIGKNNGWKQESNMGKRNNQNFVNLPFNRLIHMLQYKAEDCGIIIIVNEESYTSKCSFLDNEKVCKHTEYCGRRIQRGMFRSKEGKLINADVNGALNIIRKALPNAFADGIEGVVLHPKRCLITSYEVN
ncbi:RNA-guided endonuclease InsQ/TnpB family protein [Methanoplanus endosymbiosus]|uniref:Transposase n=1 Tax=Methanoplanus endosymbiosus TaxID=33865 RepID=A0A9E7PRI4_9EURY|nr:transposase [Methanoplanus endosymbiosus]UUX93761.1 transposase [Methanoplanus endosymbiosus]